LSNNDFEGGFVNADHDNEISEINQYRPAYPLEQSSIKSENDFFRELECNFKIIFLL
jgi:hypothetical protein